MDFLSFFYPGTEICPKRAREAGRVIDEWRLLQNAPNSPFVTRPPPRPALGYTRPSRQGDLRTEAYIAQHYGVDGWIFNYYYDGNHTELTNSLDTFLTLDNISTPHFALNICYKMPKRHLPMVPVQTRSPTASIFDPTSLRDDRIIVLSERQVSNLFSHFAVRFFGRDNYYCVGDNHFVSLYHITGLLAAYGVEGLNTFIRTAREESERYGYSLYIVGLLSVTDEKRQRLTEIHKLDLDAISTYCSLPNFNSGNPVQRYEDLVPQRVQEWYDCRATFDQTFIPGLAPGWDATPRGAAGYDPSKHGLQFPYAPVVINNNANNFAQFLDKALTFARANRPEERLVVLGPWNEWTEGSYLLPDTQEHLAKLRVVSNLKNTLP